MELILAMLAGWFFTFTGVTLGGILVFKTKRESYEPMFSKTQQSGAFNVGDDFADLTDGIAEQAMTETQGFDSEVMRKAQDRFQSQMQDTSKMNKVVQQAVQGEGK